MQLPISPSTWTPGPHVTATTEAVCVPQCPFPSPFENRQGTKLLLLLVLITTSSCCLGHAMLLCSHLFIFSFNFIFEMMMILDYYLQQCFWQGAAAFPTVPTPDHGRDPSYQGPLSVGVSLLDGGMMELGTASMVHLHLPWEGGCPAAHNTSILTISMPLTQPTGEFYDLCIRITEAWASSASEEKNNYMFQNLKKICVYIYREECSVSGIRKLQG